MILYLWQNQNTVVIGRNQNAWKECRVQLLEQEGGRLARRLSGGGAVFHDLGNLNFTFLVPTDCYDLEKQLSVIQLACRSFGIEAVRSGRNDILAEGRKFSGNAFYQSGGRSYHHGTLLVDVDMTRMSRYLNPSKAKLEAKGVDSVRSRVVNLKELAPEITIDQLKVQLAAAFQEVYHLPCKHIAPEELDGIRWRLCTSAIAAGIGDLESSFPSPSAVRTSSPGAESRCSSRSKAEWSGKSRCSPTPWTGEIAPALEQALAGCRFALPDLCQAVRRSCPDQAETLCQMLTAQEI